MAAIYSNVKYKNRGKKEEDEPSKGSLAISDDIIYSEVHIVQSDQTNTQTAPDADLSHPNLPGPQDPADSSPETVTPGWAKERLLLRSLCAILFVVGLIITVLYLGNISHKETEKDGTIKKLKTDLKEKNETIKKLKTDLKEKNENNTKLQGENDKLIKEKDAIIKQFQTDLKEKNYTNTKLQEENDKLIKDKEELIRQLKEKEGKQSCNPTAQNVDEVCCAEGWKYFMGKCYYFSTDEKTWTASRDACLAVGGDLVIINTPEEENFIKKLNNDEYYWIGLTDAVKEGDWRWLDGTKLSTTSIHQYYTWKRGNCGLMQLTTDTYYLRNTLCNNVNYRKFKRVCEAKASI
ncbi:uncharacterized protein [Salminus brasiliensis]|uniref:uncharacterized protein n=1 Tax=Salminus brasiliensis TaxID=930266 RepID=UPI003B82DAE3